MASYKGRLNTHKKTRKKTHGKIILLILFICAVILAFFFMQNRAGAPDTKNEQQSKVNVPAKPKSTSFKIFSGKEFEELYNSFAYPNTQLINENTPITGNAKADARIRQLALDRGYKLRSAPVTDTFVIVQKDMKLQQRAADSWIDLKKNAKKDGLDLKLTAAYRSAEDAKSIFLSGLKSLPLDSIAAGRADISVNSVLGHSAPPGYSRHHTGYTVDIACVSNPGVKFENSTCFKWLNMNNYLNAKKSGWIPSYPPGAGKQGPDPEPWEYVWVGMESLK